MKCMTTLSVSRKQSLNVYGYRCISKYGLILIVIMYNRCKCFLTNNYFLPKYKTHVKYITDQQLWTDFGDHLRSLGLSGETDENEVLDVIHRELSRRQNLDIESLKRKQYIKDNYERKHEDIYRLSDTHLDPLFIELTNKCKSGHSLDSVLSLVNTISSHRRIYQFPVFTQQFCDKLIEEIDNFNESSMPKSRPNTMNNYGILLSELGFDETLLTPLRENYLNPISRVFFPDWCAHALDSHRAFTVKYKANEDRELFTHFDNAEVTVNVCLGKHFDGSEVFFGEMRTFRNNNDIALIPVPNIVGYGIFHRSQQMHGSVSITDGERHNLVIWMRCSAIRNQLCPMCDSKPVLVAANGSGDGFTSC